jgi:hypothetical protein
MNQKSITNEQAERVLLAFYLASAEDEKYNEFREYYNGIVLLVLHKYLRYTDSISNIGYENVVEAYQELDRLGFTQEITAEEIDYAVKMFENSTTTN